MTKTKTTDEPKFNTISVDVEDYYHATNIEKGVSSKKLLKAESRIEESINKVLEIFSNSNTKGTFFILSKLIKKHSNLIKEIEKEGHEIASHGSSHKIAYLQSKEEFYNDVYSSKCLIEDTLGKEIYGYRAPNFSIVSKNEWAYDELVKCGFLYDSSVYPVSHPRYSNLSKPRKPYMLNREKGDILVFPLATASIQIFNKEIRLPVAGGAYWRLLPFSYIKWGLRRLNNKDNYPCNCYFHPWEVDDLQPRFNELNFLTRIRHYGGIKKLPNRIEKLINEFHFTTILSSAKHYFKNHFIKDM